MTRLPRLLAILTMLFTVPLSAQDKEKKQATDSTKGAQESKAKNEGKKKPVKTRILKAASRNPQVEPLNLKIPVTWKEVKSRSNMRAATVEIPAAKGDKEKGELAVFIFGPQSLDQNIDRWIGQFRPAGRKSKVVKGKRKGGGDNSAYYLVDISGTWKKPDGPPFLQKTKDAPGYRMLGVLIPARNALYVLKLTGPDKTAAAQAKALRNAIGGDAKTEKPHSRD